MLKCRYKEAMAVCCILITMAQASCGPNGTSDFPESTPSSSNMSDIISSVTSSEPGESGYTAPESTTGTETQTTVPVVTSSPTSSSQVPPVEKAQDFYVSAKNGSDKNAGSRNAPFLTIARAMQNAKPGSTIYIMNGTYHETIKPVSGEANKPVTITAMPGESPVCTPTVPYTGEWKKYKDNIYVADFSNIKNSINTANAQIFVDGEAMVEARYPNMGPYLSQIMDSPRAIAQAGTNENTIVTPDSIPQDIEGATVVVWPGEDGVAGWYAFTSPVASVSGNTVKLTKKLNRPENYIGLNAFSPVAGNPFWITGALSLLDAPGEYYYDSANSKMYLYMPKGDSPSSYSITVRGSSSYAVDAKGGYHIAIKGIRFYGGGIYMKGANNCHVENCSVRFADHQYASDYASRRLESSTMVTGDNNYITKSRFGPTAFNGITLGGNNVRFTDNIVQSSNYCGADFAGVYLLKSTNLEISHNTVKDSGRENIYFITETTFDQCVIRNNYIASHARLNSDCGAVYTWKTNGNGTTRIYNNFVDCGTKTPNGTMGKHFDGLYLDNYCSGFIVDHNIVVGGTVGLRTNLSNADTLYANNTVIGSEYGYGIYGYPSEQAKTNNTRFYNNLFVDVKTDLNYNATENGAAKSYIGKLINGAVPVPFTKSQRVLSSNNFSGISIITNGANQYQPVNGSEAIDGGIKLPGITDGYLGTAPDAGAIEKGGSMFAYGASWK